MLATAACSQPTAPTPTPRDPPTITCPLSQALSSPLGSPVSVAYGTATVVGGKAPITTMCTPPSGSEFPVGSTAVTCTAVDALQRTDSCVFGVTVAGPPRISLTRFVAFGDSITWGEDGNAASSSTVRLSPYVRLVGSDYPYVLQEQYLKARYTLQASLLTVENRGLPGEPAGDPATLSRFTRDVLNGRYQALLLLEGANDLYSEWFNGPSVEQPAINNLRTMIGSAKQAGIRPYLATLTPVNDAGWRGRYVAPFILGFNDRLRTLAASEGVTLVDLYQGFGGDLTLLSSDGFHPNAGGFQRMAQLFFDALKATLEGPAKGGPR